MLTIWIELKIENNISNRKTKRLTQQEVNEKLAVKDTATNYLLRNPKVFSNCIRRSQRTYVFCFACVERFNFGGRCAGAYAASFVFVVISWIFSGGLKPKKHWMPWKTLQVRVALVIRDGETIRIGGKGCCNRRYCCVYGKVTVFRRMQWCWAVSIFRPTNVAFNRRTCTGEQREWKEGDTCLYSQRRWPACCLFRFHDCTQGNGVVRVVATALNTEIGKIGKALQSVKGRTNAAKTWNGNPCETPCNHRCRAVCLLLPFTPSQGLICWMVSLAGITLAMAMLPEEFQVVLTIFLALGAWHVKNVLTSSGSCWNIGLSHSTLHRQNRYSWPKIKWQLPAFTTGMILRI